MWWSHQQLRKANVTQSQWVGHSEGHSEHNFNYYYVHCSYSLAVKICGTVLYTWGPARVSQIKGRSQNLSLQIWRLLHHRGLMRLIWIANSSTQYIISQSVQTALTTTTLLEDGRRRRGDSRESSSLKDPPELCAQISALRTTGYLFLVLVFL